MPHRPGLDASPGRTGPTWGEFLRARFATVLDRDFFAVTPCLCGGSAPCSSSNSKLGVILVTGVRLIRLVSEWLISHSYQAQGRRPFGHHGPEEYFDLRPNCPIPLFPHGVVLPQTAR